MINFESRGFLLRKRAERNLSLYKNTLLKEDTLLSKEIHYWARRSDIEEKIKESLTALLIQTEQKIPGVFRRLLSLIYSMYICSVFCVCMYIYYVCWYVGSMYIWIYVRMNVWIFVCQYVCLCVCMSIYMYIWTYARTYVCVYVYKYERMYACVYVCTYVCVDMCMYVCMCVCIYVRMCKSMYIRITYGSKYVCLCVYRYVTVYVCKDVLCIYLYMYVCVYVCMYVCMYICMSVSVSYLSIDDAVSSTSHKQFTY
jgi:hypothetical protein